LADKLNSVIEFDDELIQDADFDIDDIIDEEEEMEEDNSVDMFDQDTEDYIDEDATGEEDYADDIGVTVGEKDLRDDDEDNYETASFDSGFINQNGDLVVMDTSIPGDNFSFKYIDIENIAVVKRIRQNKNVEDLMRSIQSTGLISPVTVAPTATDGLYVLLSGFRRLLACAKVGIKRVPCIINNKVSVPEIPVLEAMYQQSKPYSIKEIVDYIDYLENEKGIMSPSMIEHLLQLESGDYTKLKDILNDNDDDIVSRLMNGQLTIGMAFKKLEQRRKNESKESQDIKRAEKVYEDEEESGVDKIRGSGEISDDTGLTDEEIQSLSISASDLEDGAESLEELIEEGNQIQGYQPHKQSPGDREYLDPSLAKAVKEKYDNTCQCCKEGGMEYVDCNDVHHIVEVYLGGSDDISNLILACVKCHRQIHLYARGELHMRPLEQMDDREREKFKRIIKLGNIIRKGLAMKGMKKEELKKLDKLSTIGRTKPGTGQVAG